MWSSVSDAFQGYMGTGLIVICYFLSLIYLWLTEKRRYRRIFFLYLPLVLLALFFNPLLAELMYRMAEDEIYWRFLWLLPMTVTLAYSCVRIYGRMEKSRGRLSAQLAALCMAGAIAASGSFIYSSPAFSRAENLYHVPDAVVDICDAIQVPGREVMAVFPLELVQYVRQYSPVTCMPYGRELTMGEWLYEDALRNEMEKDVVVMEELVPLTREKGCHYIILRPDQQVQGEPEDYNWIPFAEAGGYTVYRDLDVELIVPDAD